MLVDLIDDARLNDPSDQYDHERAKHEDLVWLYDDAGRRNDPAGATAVRTRFDDTMRTEFTGSNACNAYSYRLYIVSAALKAGHLDDTAVELTEWYSFTNPAEAEEHGGVRASCRTLLDCTVDFLEAPGGTEHLAAGDLYTRLCDLYRATKQVTTAANETGFARVRARRQ